MAFLCLIDRVGLVEAPELIHLDGLGRRHLEAPLTDEDGPEGAPVHGLQQLQLGREGHVVHVRPELVAEIAFDGVQASPQYPGGLALRFARLKRYRTDKTASQASTIADVRQIFASQQQ